MRYNKLPFGRAILLFLSLVDYMTRCLYFMSNVSAFQLARLLYSPKLPPALEDGACVRVVEGEPTTSAGDAESIRSLLSSIYGQPIITFEKCGKQAASENSKPLNVGVIFSGGQAPGGHNVIAGLFDGIKSVNSESRLYGFLGGANGLVKNKFRELCKDEIDSYRNTGGFDMIGSGRTKLETHEQFSAAASNCAALDISAIVIIGGDDSNTNACVLADYFKKQSVPIQVIGCPKTIDGDLKNEWIENSFGFDTASSVYRGLIGNIARDATSAGKYWHFIRLMGRAASHLTLECAIQTHPNITLISEEVLDKGMSLRQIVSDIAETVAQRAERGMNFGVVLVPEGLIEFIPEIRALIEELSDVFATKSAKIDLLDDVDREAYLSKLLSSESSMVFQSLPKEIRIQLCAERDPHGNVQLSVVETAKMLAQMVFLRLRHMSNQGTYKGNFQPTFHFFGYEGRCAAPTNYDASYSYSLGFNAAALVNAGKTGYMSCIRNTAKPYLEWTAGGVPLTAMMNMERRSGKEKPVIKKSLVDLDGKPFKYFAEHREDWKKNNSYVYHSNIQYFGPPEVCDEISMTLKLEQQGK